MKIITTKSRGYLDYAIGITMVVIPWLFSLTDNKLEYYLLLIAGIATIVQSLATDYELGLIKQMKMKAHLKIDFCMGVILLAMPLLFGLFPFLLCLVFGAVKIVLSICSQHIPASRGYEGSAFKRFEDSYKKFEKFPSMKY